MIIFRVDHTRGIYFSLTLTPTTVFSNRNKENCQTSPLKDPANEIPFQCSPIFPIYKIHLKPVSENDRTAFVERRLTPRNDVETIFQRQELRNRLEETYERAEGNENWKERRADAADSEQEERWSVV